MVVVESPLPLLAVGISLVLALLILAFGNRHEILRIPLAVAAAIFNCVICIILIPYALNNRIFEIHVLQMTPRIWMFFHVDQLGLIFATTAAFLWLLATIYSIGYMKGEHALTRYYGFYILCLTWTMGAAFAGNLLTLLIFYELLSVTSYIIIAHEETPEAIAAGKKYIIYILIGGTFILFAIVFTYFLAGSQTLTKTGLLSLRYGRTPLTILFTSFILGFGVKAAIMPLHGWVPDAHPAAPAPASAILSGVLVAAGCFGIMRVVYNVFGVELIRELGFGIVMAYVVSVTIIVSSVIAIDQDNLKRRLAYSTIGQMSYVILGTMLLTPNAAWGAMVHIANHAFMKGTLFMCSGVVLKQGKTRNVSDMHGIGHKLPITMICFTVAALAMIGTPPLAGFISKWLLCIGALEAHRAVFIVVLLLSSLLGAIYFLPIVYVAFFGEKKEAESDLEGALVEEHNAHHDEERFQVTWGEAPATMLVPIIIATLNVFVLGICAAFGGLPLSLVQIAQKMLFK